MWISYSGLKEGAYSGVEFPYKALSPSIGKKKIYKNLKEVYKEIVALYENLESKGAELGSNLFKYTAHFVDHGLLVNHKMQNRIKEYQFCKEFNCPPYPSLKDTPEKVMTELSIISKEFNSCIKEEQQKDKKDA
mgnify:CR=1 FL=1